MYPLRQVPENVLSSSYTVMLDGKVLGYVAKKEAARICDKLRVLKVRKDDTRVPDVTEIVFVSERAQAGQFPGIFLFTGAARMVRPVMNLAMNQIELIGSFEQVEKIFQNNLLKKLN